MERKIRLTGAITEGFVIVFSILLAFGIDAWWDGVQARAKARESLGRVMDEIAVVRDELIGGHQFQRLYQRSAEKLGAIERAEPGDTVQVPDIAFVGLLAWQVNDFALSNTKGLLASGAIDELDSPGLRHAIGRLLPLLEDLRDDQALMRDFKENHLKPAIRRRANLARAQELTNQLYYRMEMPDESIAAMTDVRVDAELQALLVELRGLYALNERQFRAVDALAEEIEEIGASLLKPR